MPHQCSLDRIVALKLIRAGSQEKSAHLLARFRTEATAAARLQHPNIVAIYEVGEQDGQPFYTMEFVAGQSLAQALSGGPLAPAKAASLVRTAAKVRLWDVPTRQLRTTLPITDSLVISVAFSKNSRLLAVATSRPSIYLWDVASGKAAGMLHGHKQQVESAAFSPDGLTLASGSRDGTLRLWNLATLREIATLEEDFIPVRLLFGPDSRTLFAAENSHQVHIYRAPTFAEIGAMVEAAKTNRSLFPER